MLKRTLAALTLVVVPCVLAAPRPATKVYESSCDAVWTAAKSVVTKHYKPVTMAEHDHLGTFEIGNDILTKRRSLSFDLKGEGNSCTVSVTGHFSGLVNNDKGDFFKRLDAEMAPPK